MPEYKNWRDLSPSSNKGTVIAISLLAFAQLGLTQVWPVQILAVTGGLTLLYMLIRVITIYPPVARWILGSIMIVAAGLLLAVPWLRWPGFVNYFSLVLVVVWAISAWRMPVEGA